MLKKGSSGSAVYELKARLYELGYLKVKPTHDRFGSDTDKAVRNFQKAVGLAVDGIVGPRTQAALDIAKNSTPASAPTAAHGTLKTMAAKMLDIIEKRVGDEYVWGAQGHLPTASYIDGRARDKPEHVDAERAARFKKYAKDHPVKPNGEPLRCEDCSGLFWAAENIVELPMDATKDIDDSRAVDLYNKYCDPVKKADLQPLDLVFSGSPISHVAIVGRDGKIYEAAGSEIGVVANKDVDTRTMKSIYGPAYGCGEYYSKGKWTKFGRLKIMKGIDLRNV